jgi:hypothetical protein
MALAASIGSSRRIAAAPRKRRRVKTMALRPQCANRDHFALQQRQPILDSPTSSPPVIAGSEMRRV